MAKRRNGRKVRKSIPWELHMAIVKLQGAEELEYHEACIRAAALIEGGDKFREAVNAEANRLYKRKFFGEMNKARSTTYQKGYQDGHAKGKEEGFESCRRTYRITYPCNKCGGEMTLYRGGKDTVAAIDYLRSRWGHENCEKASKP